MHAGRKAFDVQVKGDEVFSAAGNALRFALVLTRNRET
jgi:hypothetical protein